MRFAAASLANCVPLDLGAGLSGACKSGILAYPDIIWEKVVKPARIPDFILNASHAKIHIFILRIKLTR